MRWFPKAARILLEWAIFLAAAVWITWPLAAHWTASLPLGCEEEPVVPLLNLWTQWWNGNRFEHAYADYWQAPIFFPAQHALAFSEPQPVSGCCAWLLRHFVRTPEAAYNGLLWMHLALNGWCTHLLFRTWRTRWGWSVVAGLMVEWMPAVHWQLGVVQLVPLWGVVLTLLFLLRFALRPNAVRAMGLGASAGLAYLLCSYYGLMLLVLLLIAGPLLLRRRLLAAAHLRWVALACVVATLLAGPIIRRQWQVARESPAIPPRELVAELSSQPIHLLRTPWRQWITMPGVEPASRAVPWAFSPGTIKLTLALVGVGTGLYSKRQRRRTLFLAALVVAATALAMGPTLAVAGYGPYDVLAAVFPGYAQLRNIHRFATLAQLALVVLAGLGLAHTGKCVARFAFPVRGSKSVGGQLTGWAAALLVLLEAVPASPRLWATPSTAPSWVAAVELHSQPADVIALFPMPRDNSLAESRSQTLAMYWQMRHHRPMVNGYSGLLPAELVAREARLQSFPSVATLAELASTGVDLLIVPADLAEELQRVVQLEPLRDAVRLEPVQLDDKSGVFRLWPHAP